MFGYAVKMNEWKPLIDVLKNLPKEKYKAFSRLRLKVRYNEYWRKISGDEEGKVGKIYDLDHGYYFNYISGKNMIFIDAKYFEVFIDEQAEKRLFVWVLSGK